MANEHVTGDETYGLADTLQWLAVLYADISGSSRIYGAVWRCGRAARHRCAAWGS